jgi:hypothetical protein
MMEKWEYIFVDLDGSRERAKELNNYGGAGWEAVGMSRVGSVTTVLLKRQSDPDPAKQSWIGSTEANS